MPKSILMPRALLCLLVILGWAPVAAQPFVKDVVHSGSQTLRPGDTLHVTATGSPGGQATVEIMGTPGADPLTETSSGRYETDLVIPKGLTVSNKLLVVTIKQGGQQALGQSQQGITITPAAGGLGIGNLGIGSLLPRSTPPSGIGSQGAPPPSRPRLPLHQLGVSNLQGGMLLGDTFQIRGRGEPGSQVMATVAFLKQDFLSHMAGVMLKFKSSARVDGNGQYAINLNANGVRHGQVMHITVADDRQSSPIKLAVEKGPGHIRQTDAQKNPRLVSKPNLKPFFDSENHYGFNVPPGWTQTDNDPIMDIKFVKGIDSRFSVIVRPSNGKSVDDGVQDLKTTFRNAEVSVREEQSLQISGLASKAMVISHPSGSEGIVTCTVANGNFYHALVESSVLATQPLIQRDLHLMLESFFIK